MRDARAEAATLLWAVSAQSDQLRTQLRLRGVPEALARQVLGAPEPFHLGVAVIRCAVSCAPTRLQK
jgi:hypothetical protein